MDTDDKNSGGLDEERRWASSAMSLGTSIVAGVGLFTFIGYWLDKRRGGGILFSLVGFSIGILYMVYEFWRVVSALNSRQDGSKGKNLDDKRSGKS